MLLEKLSDYLIEIGFSSIRLNIEHIYLFQQRLQKDGTIFTVLLFDFDQSNFTVQQFLSVRNQIEEKYRETEIFQTEFLCLLYGNESEQMKECAALYDCVWIINSSSKALILFENQSERFSEFRIALGDFLTESSRMKSKSFSLMNTLMVIINVIIFSIINYLLYKKEKSLLDYGALFWPLVKEEGEYYRLFTYMFLHSGKDHILNNMIVLLFIGDNLERAIGKWKYLIIYLFSGVLAGIVSMGYHMYQETTPMCVGASGAIFGVCGAVAYLIIINKGRLEDLSKGQMILFVFFGLYGGFTSQGVDNAAHIGGLLAGIFLTAILYRKTRAVYKQEEKSL